MSNVPTMIKLTLTIENNDITISRDYLFEDYEELLSKDWNQNIESIAETVADVPYNETEIPGFQNTMTQLNNISIFK